MVRLAPLIPASLAWLADKSPVSHCISTSDNGGALIGVSFDVSPLCPAACLLALLGCLICRSSLDAILPVCTIPVVLAVIVQADKPIAANLRLCAIFAVSADPPGYCAVEIHQGQRSATRFAVLFHGGFRMESNHRGTDRSRASAQAGHCASDPACRPSPRSALGARRLPAFRPAKSVPARRA